MPRCVAERIEIAAIESHVRTPEVLRSGPRHPLQNLPAFKLGTYPLPPRKRFHP